MREDDRKRQGAKPGKPNVEDVRIDYYFKKAKIIATTTEGTTDSHARWRWSRKILGRPAPLAPRHYLTSSHGLLGEAFNCSCSGFFGELLRWGSS